MEIEELVQRQRDFFRTGRTKDVAFRIAALQKLENSIVKYEKEINEALYADLHKSAFEGYMTEVGLSLSELRFLIKNTAAWSKTRRVRTPLAQFHAKSYVVQEPYGAALVMSPWNYPFMLSLEPAAGAIAAGNCCIIKPSAYAPATSAILKRIIGETFQEDYVAVVEGGRQENARLLEQKFDYIFFTGSVAVGHLVMEKAAAHLTPVTLELGGKSPCIVDRDAKLSLAAKRIVFGKFLNSGQTCVAPDYCFVHESVKEEFIGYLVKWIDKMIGKQPFSNPEYPKMINEKHYDRVLGLVQGETIVTGGCGKRETLQIAPTVLKDVSPDAPVMQEEIFGPVLPVMTFRDISEVERFVTDRPKPLALYLFTNSRETADRITGSLSFGGGCINDTIIHLATSRMGFGGVGASGMGSYHGKKSFETFSHEKSVVNKSTWMDLPIRYMPYTKTKDKLMRKFLK